MPRDEFNSVNITNDRQVNGTEFGNFSRSEYTITSENSIHTSETNNVNRSELNEITQGDSRDNDDIDKQLTQRERDLIEEAANGNSGSSAASSGGSSSSSASSSSSSSASSGGGATASSASASGATGAAASAGSAAAASGAVAASSIVAVSAFVITIAAPIVLSNARIKEETAVVQPSENEVYYSLDLVEPFEDENYIVTVTNETYDQYQPLVEGINTGTFAELTVDRDYELMVIEGTESEISRILYRQTFRTFKEEEPGPTLVSEVRGATLSNNADFINNTFDVTLDYVDDYDKFSNFAVTLTRANQVQPQGLHQMNADETPSDGSGDSKTFSLEKTTATQTIQAGSDFLLNAGSFTYSFSYESTDNPGQALTITTPTSAISFVDNVHQSVVNSATLLEEADFREAIVTVNLDFVDDYNKFSNFTLTLQEISPEPDWQPDAMVYALQKVNGNQTVEVNSGENETSLEDRSFNYMITYMSTDESIEQVANSGQITFTDPTFVSEFYGATINSQVDMTNKVFYVELNYQDDYYMFCNIELSLSYLDEKNETVEYSFSLDDVTDPQPVSFDEMEERTYNYEFTYHRYDENQDDPAHVISSGTVTFDDPTWVPSTANFYGVNFISADYSQRTVTAQLDYLDPDGFLGEDMELILFDHSKNVTKKFNTTNGTLEKTTEPQVLSLEVEGDQTFEGGIDVSSTGGFDYSLSYVDNNEDKYIYNYDLTVEDENGLVNGLDFKFDTKPTDSTQAYANSQDETFRIYSAYNNYFGNLEWSGFQLDICAQDFDSITSGGNDQPTQSDTPIGRYSLNTSTGGWRNVFYINDSQLDQLDLLSGDYDYYYYRITYFANVDDAMTGDEARSTFVSSTITFVDELTPSVNGVNVGSLVDVSDFYYFPIQILFDNPNASFRDVQVTAKVENSEEIDVTCASYSGSFEKDMDWQVGSINHNDLEELGIDENNPTGEVIISVYDSDDIVGESDPLFTDTVEFTLQGDDDLPIVYGARFDGNMLTQNQNDQYQIGLQHLIFTGYFDESEAYSPRFYFTIHSGTGSYVNNEQVTRLEFIPTDMSASINIVFGALDDSYFNENNEIEMTIKIKWFDENNDIHETQLCSHQTFYKQA